MIRRAVQAVVGHVILEDGEGARGIRRLAHGDHVEVPARGARVGAVVLQQRSDKPAPRLPIVKTLGITDEGSDDARLAANNLRGQAEKSVQVRHARERCARGIEHANHVVD